MIKKILVILLFLITLGAGGFGTYYFYSEYQATLSDKLILSAQNAQLQSELATIGEMVTVYTVGKEVESGRVIQASDLVTMTIPKSSVVSTTVTQPKQIVGLYWKVDLEPGTVLTSDLVMSGDFTETIYEQDMTFDYLPLGLSVGDYVDIRITFPYGETYYIMTHKRIEQIVLNNSTVKFYVTAAEQALWVSALKDLALHREEGMSIYITKYVEPGIQDSMIAYYPVRAEVASSIKDNPNIPNLNAIVNTTLRNKIDAFLANSNEEDTSYFLTGTVKETKDMLTAAELYEEDTESTFAGSQQLVDSNKEVEPQSDDTENFGSLSDVIQNLDETLDDFQEGVVGGEEAIQ